MPQNFPIQKHARYVTPFAVGYSDTAGGLALVSADSPLPVTSQAMPAPAAPLVGEASSTTVVGPFAATRGLPIHLELAGVWDGKATFQRSTDGGATRRPLTAGGQPWAVFTGSANEPVWEETESDVTFWLDVALASGTLAYRISQ